MAITVAEKQKRYGQQVKQDPEKYEHYFQADQKRWETRRSSEARGGSRISE